jgi:hypothetical protein
LPNPNDPNITDPKQVPPSRLSGLLVRLDEHLERAGAPLARAWKPGITLGEFRVFAPDIGQPPAEVAEWFAWHNGAHFVVVDPLLPNNFEPLDLDLAMRDREVYLRFTGPGAGFDSYGTYLPEWLPICGMNDSLIVADCSGGPFAPAPMHYVDNASTTGYDTVLLPSLTAMVALWIDLFDRGCYHYDTEDERWDCDDYWAPGEPRPITRWLART